MAINLYLGGIHYRCRLLFLFYDPPRIVIFWPTYKTLLKRCQVMHFSTLIGSLCRLGTFNTVIVAQFSSKRCND